MNWKESYRAALVEVDPARLLHLIHDAEAAISQRAEVSPAVTIEERQELGDATSTLCILKNHAYGRATPTDR